MTTVVTAISARLEAKFVVELGALDDVKLQRRCADIPELLGVVEAGGAQIAAISPDFPGMSGTVISELVMRGASVLAVTSATSAIDQRQCEAWGITSTYVLGDGDLADIVNQLRDMAGEEPESTNFEPREEPIVAPSHHGNIICLWGPPGAPGRTTTAIHLARQLGAHQPTLLIDADTYAPSIATFAGLMDDASGILALARMVDAGTLNPRQMEGVIAHIEHGLDIVTGIGSASRWHELSPSAFTRILDVASMSYRWIVIDISSEFSIDEELMFDTLAPSRNAVSSLALSISDHVVALASCDPVGLGRFVPLWDDVRELDATVHVVLNKARHDSVGGAPETVAAGALTRFAGAQVNVVIPDAQRDLDAEVLLGVFSKPPRASDYERAIEELRCLITGESLAEQSRGRRRRRPVRLRAS